jgi:hypothetical protein
MEVVVMIAGSKMCGMTAGLAAPTVPAIAGPAGPASAIPYLLIGSVRRTAAIDRPGDRPWSGERTAGPARTPPHDIEDCSGNQRVYCVILISEAWEDGVSRPARLTSTGTRTGIPVPTTGAAERDNRGRAHDQGAATLRVRPWRGVPRRGPGGIRPGADATRATPAPGGALRYSCSHQHPMHSRDARRASKPKSDGIFRSSGPTAP